MFGSPPKLGLTLCHGDTVHPKSPRADSFNPPPPQFMNDMADMPEYQNFYIVEYGIRWTGMPGWKNVLSERQSWQVVTLLSHNARSPTCRQASFRRNRTAKSAANRFSVNHR
jgi:mono/diheme cytochrome c family protein